MRFRTARIVKTHCRTLFERQTILTINQTIVTETVIHLEVMNLEGGWHASMLICLRSSVYSKVMVLNNHTIHAPHKYVHKHKLLCSGNDQLITLNDTTST